MTHEDVPGIVIEPGTAWTRLGVAGEVAPRVVTPSVVARNATDGSVVGYDDVVEQYTGPDTEIHTPIIDGVLHDHMAAAGLWKWMSTKYLGMDLSEQPLTVTEEIWNPALSRTKLLETAFETLEVPLFQLVRSPVCAALQTAHATALVVQVGAATASAVPIVDGSPIYKAAMHSRFAGDFVTAHSHAQIKHLGVDPVPKYLVGPLEKDTIRTDRPATSSYHTYQVARMLDQFKQVVCLASPTPLTGPEIRGVRTFEFPNGVSQLLGQERLMVVEPLFKPAATPLPGADESSTNGSSLPTMALGLSELVYQAYQKAESRSETAIHLISNIVLCGGTAQIPGVQQRIEADLQKMLQNNYQPRFVDVGNRTNAVWSGASVLASLPSFDPGCWITKGQYDEMGAQQLVEKRFE